MTQTHLIPVKDYENLYRDEYSKAIVCANSDEFEAYKKRMEFLKSKGKDPSKDKIIQKLEVKVNELERQLTNLLTKLENINV